MSENKNEIIIERTQTQKVISRLPNVLQDIVISFLLPSMKTVLYNRRDTYFTLDIIVFDVSNWNYEKYFRNRIQNDRDRAREIWLRTTNDEFWKKSKLVKKIKHKKTQKH